MPFCGHWPLFLGDGQVPGQWLQVPTYTGASEEAISGRWKTPPPDPHQETHCPYMDMVFPLEIHTGPHNFQLSLNLTAGQAQMQSRTQEVPAWKHV